MDAIDRYVQEAGGLKEAWARLARSRVTSARGGEKRNEQEQLMREIGA